MQASVVPITRFILCKKILKFLSMEAKFINLKSQGI